MAVRPSTLGRPRTRSLRGPGLIRLRLWLAMLGLAIIPMVGIVLVQGAFAARDPVADDDGRAWATATAVGGLLDVGERLGSRVLGVATDPATAKLVDGIDGGAETRAVERLLTSIEGSDRGLVRGACIVRTSTRSTVTLPGTVSGSSPSSGCGAPTLVARALAQPPGGIVRSTAWGPDRARRLLLSTELIGTNRRTAGVLTVEVGLRDLFAAARPVADGAAAALLIDIGRSEIVASIGAAGVVDGTSSPLERPLGDLRVRINGIVSGHDGTARALAAAGWIATATPLWETSDGAELGVIQFWPRTPPGPSVALIGTLLIFALAVFMIAILTARHFLQPFDDLARSQANLEVLYREARQDSLHDALTGLGNHRAFQEELDRQIELYLRHRVPVALLLMDLDDLKVVNDGEGHPAGDRLLVGMANAIRDALRYGDRAFRIGGDEFAVILPHTESEDALIAANRLRHFCLRPAAGERVIPFSGGISGIPAPARDRTELFSQADAALYRSKRNGRGTVAIFDRDRDLVPEAGDDAGSATAVRDIIRLRNMTPVYQPIVDLRSGAILGYEGLIRPGKSAPFTNPGQLFVAAAASGRTVELDLACFEVVAAGVRDLAADKVVSLNLSPRTLESQDQSPRWLLEILARYDVSPGRVIIEMTEREDISDLERLRTNVAALQHAGIRLAADDVGAGNAGLRLLSQVRFDIVKIDLSLVQQGDETSRAVVRSLIDLAERQGAIAIAEGIETAEHLNVLRELGISTGQGYLLGRPSPNLSVATIEIEALAAGTVIVHGAAPSTPQPAATQQTAAQQTAPQRTAASLVAAPPATPQPTAAEGLEGSAA